MKCVCQHFLRKSALDLKLDILIWIVYESLTRNQRPGGAAVMDEENDGI